MTPLRLAVVGVGDVAQRDYLPEFTGSPGARRSPSSAAGAPERAQDVAERFGVPRWSTD